MVDMSTLIGTVRRFGLEGPPYEVVGPSQSTTSAEQQMRIHLLESDEYVDYPLAQLLNDPTEG